MMEQNGWGYTKKPTPQRDKPKLHYFNDGRSLCHGTAPVKIIKHAHSSTDLAARDPDACPTCVAKKRTIDTGRSQTKGAHVR